MPIKILCRHRAQRKIPDKVYNQMINIARLMYNKAIPSSDLVELKGSDSAFELGAKG